MKNKLIAFLVAMLTAMNIISVLASDAGLTVTAASTDAEAGATVAVPITVSGNPGIATLGFDIAYDSSAMTLQSVTNGTVFSADAITEGDKTKDPYTVSATAISNTTASGILVTLNFLVSSTCASGDYNITLSAGKLGGAGNIDERSVALSFANGTVTVKTSSTPSATPTNSPTASPTTEPTAVTTGLAVSVQNSTANAGATAAVPIMVAGNPGIATLGFDVAYDSSAMTLQSITSGTVFAADAITEGDKTKDPYTVSATATSNTTANGILVTLNFAVNSTCASGDYDITLSTGKFGGAGNIKEESVPLSFTSGTITVKGAYDSGVTMNVFSVDGVTTTVNLTNGNTSSVTGNIIIVAYDINGRMTSCKVSPQTLNSGTSDINIMISGFAYKTLRAMFLDSHCDPLCASVIYPK